MRQFNKPPLCVADQIALLRARGLQVLDDSRAARLLDVVTLFRLCPYMRPFEIADGEGHLFKEGAKLADIVAIYRFDGALRQIIMDALERVEVSVRTCISNHMCCEYSDAHWYLNRIHFQNSYRHDDLLAGIRDKQNKEKTAFQRECDRIERAPNEDAQKRSRIDSRKRDNYARFYSATYDTPALPPSWAIFEDLSMGAVSKLYQGLAKDGDRKSISRRFDVPGTVFVSWLHTLTFVRNICAHHGRLWNRELAVPPKLPKQWGLSKGAPNLPSPSHRIYIVATMLAYLMPLISPDTHWRKRFIDLIAPQSNITLRAMGFPAGWRNESCWQIES